MPVKVGVIQSNYLPWRGYFDFIDEVDVFIIYDEVQYTKNDWRNRNQIKTHQGPLWITVPVKYKFSDRTTIMDTPINYTEHWQKKQVKTISLAYGKAQYFKAYANDLFDIICTRFPTISELNVALIKWVMKELDIRSSIKLSADIRAEGGKTGKLIGIINKVGGTEYLAGPQSKNYLDEKMLIESGISLAYKSYDYPAYTQLHGSFISNVSVIDLLFNCGPRSREYLKSRSPNAKAI